MLKRPVTNTVLIIAILALGIISLRFLPVNLLPEIQSPTLLVSVDWPGVGAHELEQVLGEQMEAQLATIQEVTAVETIIKRGKMLFSLRFGWQTNMDIAFLNAREKIEQIRPSLPDGVERPQLIRSNPSEEPVAVLAVYARTNAAPDTDLRVKRWTEQVLSRRLEQLDGVAQAVVTGAAQPELHIQFRPETLMRYGLSVAQLESALRNANLFSASGEFRDGWYQYSVTIDSRLETLDEIRSLPLSVPDAPEVKLTLNDVAEVVTGRKTPDAFARLDGRPVISVLVKKRYGANTVEVVESLGPVLEEVNQSQQGIATELLYEQASVIETTISNLLQTLLLGGILSIIVLFLFLGDRRLPLTIGIAIPTSVMLTFFIMYLFDIQINIISLSGLTLGIGLLVDNAIIVIENISRYHRNERSITEAARLGTREIALPVTASTFTTISVFVPLLFLGGFEGVFFRDQAFTLSVSLLASLFVALILIPGIVVRVKRNASSQSDSVLDETPRPRWLFHLYERLLHRMLNHRLLSVSVFVAGTLFTIAGFLYLPKEIMPEIPPERMEFAVSIPANSAISTTEKVAEDLRDILQASGFSDGVLMLGGYTDQTNIRQMTQQNLSRFTLSVPTPSDSERKRLDQTMQKFSEQQPDWRIEQLETGQEIGSLLNYDEAPLIISWISENRSALTPWMAQYDTLQRRAGFNLNPQPLFKRTVETLVIRPDEDQLQRYGLTVRDLEQLFATHTDGIDAGTWLKDDEERTIRIMEDNSGRFSLPQLKHNERFIPLHLVAEIDTMLQPEVVERRNQAPVKRMVSSLSLYESWNQIDEIEAFNRSFTRQTGIELETGGIISQLKQFVREMSWLLLLSVGLIYLILAMQYESLLYPAIILISVPFAWLGAVLMLWMFGVSLNMFSFLGILVLTGIAVNDAILKVDFMRRYMEEKGDLRQAVLMAGKTRFRPVLMTTFTTVFGLIPMVIPIGEGIAYRQSLGFSLIGGMISATLLTLVIIPVIFEMVQEWRGKTAEKN